MSKRLILIAAVALVLCCALPMFVGCSSEEPLSDKSGDWQYTLEDGKAVLTKYLGNEANVVVPASITVVEDGQDKVLAVSKVGDNAFLKIAGSESKWRERDTYSDNNTLVSVTISDGITEIGNMAFYQCRNLTQVNLPESMQKIGDFAFFGCSKLQSIVLPAGVNYIGAYSFRQCGALTSVTVLSTDKLPDLGDKAFYMVNEKSSDDDQYYINSELKIYVPQAAMSLYDADKIEAERRESKKDNHKYWKDYINAGCIKQLVA